MISPPIDIAFSPESKATIARMANLPFILRRAIARGMDTAAELTIGKVREERLTGLGPFPPELGKLGVGKSTPHHRGGQLRESLYRTPATVEGDTISAQVGTPIVYGGVHEFGFNGQVHVGSFTRRVRSRDEYAIAERTSGKTGRRYKAKVQIASGVTTVRAHTRWQQVPARHWLGHGIADAAPLFTRKIGEQIATDAREALGGSAL